MNLADSVNSCVTGIRSMDSRPAIPTALKRQVLVEAGHRCAVPTCRQIPVDVHHIVPWADCHKHEFDNLIALFSTCHRRVHEGLLKNQKIDALSSEVSTLAEQIEEDQLQINTLKHQVANLINQGVS